METSILGLRTVVYMVSDLDAGKEWYTKAFRKEPYFDESFYVGYDIGGYELGIMPETKEQKRGDSVEAYWGVEDIEAEYNRFLALGAKTHTEIKDVGDGIKVATLHDPWGNILGIIYNPHFKLP